MINKKKMLRQCAAANRLRRVERGKAMDCSCFFDRVQGDLLLTGSAAGETELTAELLRSCQRKRDLPTVVLTSHPGLFTSARGVAEQCFCPAQRDYHLFFGMSVQQLLRFIHMTGEALGIQQLANVMLFADAVVQVAANYYTFSLPALMALLEMEDGCIADRACGRDAAIIRGNPQAGQLLRQICQYLQYVFSSIAVPDSETKKTLCSGVVQRDMTLLYAVSSNQELMNSYLREALDGALKCTMKLRVVVDEVPFTGENDELLDFLLRQKRMGRVKLVLLSRSVREAVYGRELDFGNVVLFPHDDPAKMEEASRVFFGSYTWHYPMQVKTVAPALFFSLRRGTQWQISTMERLRVAAEDLAEAQMAVRTSSGNAIYLLPLRRFLPEQETGLSTIF